MFKKYFCLATLFIFIPLYTAETPLAKPAYFTKEQIENLNFEALLKPKEGNIRLQYLKNLQCFAEGLISLSSFYKFFKKWLPTIRAFEKNQGYAYPLQDPLIILSKAYGTPSPLNLERVFQSKWGRISYKMLPENKQFWIGWLNITTSEALSLELQIEEMYKEAQKRIEAYREKLNKIKQEINASTDFAEKDKLRAKEIRISESLTQEAIRRNIKEEKILNNFLYKYNTIPEIELLAGATLYAIQLDTVVLHSFNNHYMHEKRMVCFSNNAIIPLLFNKIFPYNELKQIFEDVYQEHRFNFYLKTSQQTVDITQKHTNFLGISDTLTKILSNTEILIPAYQALYQKILNAINDEIRSEKSLEIKRELFKYKKSSLYNNPLPEKLSFYEEVLPLPTATPDLPILQPQKAKKAPKSTAKKGRSRPKRKEQPEKETTTPQLSLTKQSVIPKNLVEPEVAAAPIKMSYAPRVEQWFNDAFAETQSYNDVLYHSFSRLADKYLLSIGKKIPYANRTIKGETDTQYSLLGQVIYQDGTARLGIFHLTVDPKNVCYHRGITFNINRDSLFQDYFKDDFWRVIHRADDAAEDVATAPKFTLLINEESFIEKEDSFVVKIRDNRLGITLVLFKPAPAI